MSSALCFLAFIVGLFASLSTAIAEDRLLTLAHPNRNDPFDNATGAMAVVFKSLVESGSSGSIRVDVYPDGQLGSDEAVAALVKNGVIQSAIVSVSGIARIYPLIGALDVPFAFPNISSTYAVFDGPFGQRLADDIARKTGLQVLGFGDSGGFFAITNSVRPIKGPGDVAGLTIRTMGLETHKEFIRSLGGTPISLSWSEVYGALQGKVADGQMNPIPIIRFARLDEVQTHLTLTNHFFAPYVWLMNSDFWTSLDSQGQAAIRNAAKSAIVSGRGLSRLIEVSDRGLPALKQRMNIYLPTRDEISAFRDATQPAVKTYIEGALGSDGANMMRALIDAIAIDRDR
jgi:tripartite ATP-independent transporter DctP family solute receptor